MSSSSDRAHDVLAIAQDVVLLYSLLGGMPRLLSTLDGDEYVEGPEGEEGKALVAHVFTDPLRQVGKISVTAAARRRGSGEIASTTQPTNGITVFSFILLAPLDRWMPTSNVFVASFPQQLILRLWHGTST